jgi:type II secretory pathway pseudopilin PulG
MKKRTPIQHGFTLVEAMAAIALTVLAGSVLMYGSFASIQTTDDAIQQTVAYGLAQQLMDEVMGCRYFELGTTDYYATTLGPTATESATHTRQSFDDIGDFNGYRGDLNGTQTKPPTDFYGKLQGTDDGQGGTTVRNPNFQCSSSFLQNWRQQIDVYYVKVDDTNVNDIKVTTLPAGQTSDYRAVEVRIVYNDPTNGSRTLATIRRIVPYLPPLPST